jgi:hypothetical protein
MTDSKAQTIKLEFTVDEVNVILDALGNLPFKTVYGIIGQLQSQARTQLDSQSLEVSPDQNYVVDCEKKSSDLEPLS